MSLSRVVLSANLIMASFLRLVSNFQRVRLFGGQTSPFLVTIGRLPAAPGGFPAQPWSLGALQDMPLKNLPWGHK